MLKPRRRSREASALRAAAALIVASVIALAISVGFAPLGLVPILKQTNYPSNWIIFDPSFGPNPLIDVSAGRIVILRSSTPLPEGRAYAMARHPFATVVLPIDWFGMDGVEETSPPAWSIHATDWSDRWSPEIRLVEVGLGWPMRFLVLRRGESPNPRSWAVFPPHGEPQSIYGEYDFIYIVQWLPLLANTLFFMAIIVILRGSPWAALWLRRYLRRRRGLCVACAYPVRGFAQCSECGTGVDARLPAEGAGASRAWSIKRTWGFFFVCVAIGIGAMLTAATVLAGFATLLHRHGDRGWMIDDLVYAEDLRGGLESGRIKPLLSKGSTPDGYRYFTARHVFASTVRGVAWEETRPIPASATPSQPPSRPPSWSLHRFDWTLNWPPETALFEVAVGWPMRCVVAHRGEVRGSNPPTLVLHRGGSQSDYGKWDLRGFVLWVPMAINVACWAGIVVVLFGTVRAAVVLRSRRGRHRREAPTPTSTPTPTPTTHTTT